jgi:signal transduction histidine kinase
MSSTDEELDRLRQAAAESDAQADELRRTIERLQRENHDLTSLHGELAAMAIKNAALFDTERAARHEAETLLEAAQAVNTSLDLSEVLQMILAQLRRVVACDSASVQEIHGDRATIVAGIGFMNPAIGLSFDLTNENIPNGIVVRALQPFILSDVQLFADFRNANPKAVHIRSWLGVPLLSAHGLVGMLTLDKSEPDYYTARHARLAMAFAAQAAVAIQNARLYAAANEDLAGRKQVITELKEAEEQLRTALRDRIRVEEELVRAREAAEAANMAKSAFLANMSHELRTPLNAIIGFSAVLESTLAPRLSDKQLRFLRNINTSGEYLLGIINNVLDLSKIEAGKMTVDFDEVDVGEAIEGICRVLRGVALPRRIDILFDVAEDLFLIEADPVKVKQILYNLISNAIKFSPDASTIRVTARSLPAEGSPLGRKAIEVRVRDQGIGIDPADQEAIFHEFRQILAPAHRPQGTGLGLTLVKRFIDLHGGTISVRSKPGQGSEFTFILPRRQTATERTE